MYLEEFLELSEERYLDPGSEFGVSPSEVGSYPSSHLAKTAAAYIVELIERGFDVFDFIELIYCENSFYEQRQGFKLASSEEEIPF